MFQSLRLVYSFIGREQGKATVEEYDKKSVATLALARDQGKGVARLRAYK